jgi:hypothetical protein
VTGDDVNSFFIDFIDIFIDTGGCCISDIIVVHQSIYYQFTYFTRRQGAIRERDAHITCTQ